MLLASGTVTGRHKFPSGNTAGRPADPATGSIYFNTQTAKVEQFDGSVWQGRTGFPATTEMLFKQATAPTGWTRVVDAGNTDATIILRLNSEVPATGGTWTISGGSVSSHTLTTAEMPSHQHELTSGIGEGAVEGIKIGVNALDANRLTSLVGGGGGHVHPFAHDGTWRPKHVDVIVASKD